MCTLPEYNMLTFCALVVLTTSVILSAYASETTYPDNASGVWHDSSDSSSYTTADNAPVIEWVRTTPEEAYKLANRAVVAGHEGHDKSPLWVIRAKFHEDLVPGKLPIKYKVAYVPWGGKENPVTDIEVCCADPRNIKWVPASNGKVPPNAVVGGHKPDGDPLYIGRAYEQNALTPGKARGGTYKSSIPDPHTTQLRRYGKKLRGFAFFKYIDSPQHR